MPYVQITNHKPVICFFPVFFLVILFGRIRFKLVQNHTLTWKKKFKKQKEASNIQASESSCGQNFS